MKLKKLLDNFIPKPTRPYLICLTAIHFFVYYVGRILGRFMPVHDMSLNIDSHIPLWNPAMCIYVLSFFFWIFSYILITADSPERCRRIFIATATGEAIAFLFYIFLPTTMVRPEVNGSGIFAWLTSLVYAADEPRNLFPSLHCYLSYMCWRGTVGAEKIPRGYRVFAAIFAVLIYASTLLVKQHVLIDTFPAIIIGELTWFISPYLEKLLTHKRNSRA